MNLELTGCYNCESDEHVLGVAELIEMPECSRQHAVEQRDAQAGVRDNATSSCISRAANKWTALSTKRIAVNPLIKSQEIEIFRQEH